MAGISDIVGFFGSAALIRVAVSILATIAVLVLMAVVLRRRIREVLASTNAGGSAVEGAAIVLVLASLMALSLLTAIQLLASLGFLFGVGIGPAHAILAVGAALILGYIAAAGICPDSPRRAWAIGSGIAAIAAALSILLAGVLYDVSWDGNATYQQAVVKLASGWNPMAHMSALPSTVGADYWIQVYPKGSWLIAAGLYALTGHLEQAKAAHLLLIGVDFALAVALLVTLAPRSWKRAVLFGALIALNPITMTQVFTFMYDGEVASLLFAWLLLAGLLWTRFGRWPLLLALAGTTLMLAAIKLTALVYVVILCVALFVVVLFRPPPLLRVWRPAVVLFTAILIGVAFVGYNPYVTNTLQRGSPFYPLVGPGSMNLMTAHMPGNFAGKDRVTKLLLSTFSASAEAAGPGSSSHLKLPFALSLAELRPFAGSTTRVAGLGPWFGAAPLLALVALVLLLADRRTGRDPWVLGTIVAELVVLSTVLLNPESWWARYSPQLWLLPVLVAAVACYRGRGWTQRIGYLVAIVLVADALMVAGVNLTSQIYATARVTKALQEARSWTGPVRIQQNEFITTWVKFKELRIPHDVVPDESQLPGGVHVPYLDSVIYPGR